MKKPKAIALGAIAILVAISATLLWRNDREPTYQGQPLRYWVERLPQPDDDEVSVEQAREAMRQIGPAAVPHLVKWIQAKEGRFERTISAGYYKLPIVIRRHLPELTDAHTLNLLGVEGLVALGPEASAAVPALASTLADADAPMKLYAALVLISVGKEGVPSLIEGVRNKNAEVRRAVAEASLMAIEKKPLLPELHAPLTLALQDEDEWVRLYSAQTLLRLDSQSDAALRVVIELVKDAHSDARQSALYALDGYASRATELIPNLIAILEEESSASRPAGLTDSAICILWQMGPAAKEAVPTLTQLLSRREYRHVPIAARALGAIGPEARAAVPALREVANGTNWIGIEPLAAAIAVWQVGRDTNTILAVLPRMMASGRYSYYLNSSKFATNTETIDILGGIGPAAKEAVPALQPLLSAQSEAVRAATLRALQKIDPAGNWQSVPPSPVPDKAE